MKLHFFHKILIVFVALVLTFAYAYYEKSKFYGASNSTELVLKELPSFQVEAIADKSIINSKEFASESNGVFVHIWGTWCGPCEAEMPEFLSYAAKLQERGVKFLLIAVNDEVTKIHRFLKRFPQIPKNVTFAIDNDNRVMDLLGTLKVPETFLFSNTGRHINKFIGPQEWQSPSYVTRLDFWLSGHSESSNKVESH